MIAGRFSQNLGLFFSDVREFFTLDQLAERARSVQGDAKVAIASDVTRARELRRAADVLWEGGSPAQALRLASEAFAFLAPIAKSRAKGATDAPKASMDLGPELIGLGADVDDTACIVTAENDLVAPLPQLDKHVLPAHAEMFVQLREALIALERIVEPYGMNARDLAARRIRRRTRAGVVFTLIAIALVLLVLARFRTRTVASGTYSDKYDSMNVLDGNLDSEWLLPTGSLGWIDIYLSPSRTVHRLKLVNAHNHEFLDRGTNEFRVEIYSKGVKVGSTDAAFSQFTSSPGWLTVDLGEQRKIDRIRIVIKSYYFAGAGLGEVSVD